MCQFNYLPNDTLGNWVLEADQLVAARAKVEP